MSDYMNQKEDLVLDALAFGAHADDLELGCGGTLIKLAGQGHQTGGIALTRGEMGTRGAPASRAREFTAAAGIMGLTVHEMLDIPDARVEVTWENQLKVIRQIRKYRPRIVFAPYWIDRHPDHEHTSRLVREAAFLAGLAKVETGQSAHRPRRILYYATRFEFSPSFIVDISAEQEKKLAAIKAYHSQFAAAEPETSISRPDFLETIVARSRLYGAAIGVRYGEPFLSREAIRVDDPVEFFGPECAWTLP